MEWHCIECGRKNQSGIKICMCGYKATRYDLAASAEDTGRYLVNRISVPSIDVMMEKQTKTYIKMSRIIMLSMLSGVIVTSIIIFIVHLIKWIVR
jgi:hypothetical protein